MLALYLMTSPHTTITGTFRLPDGYACEDLKWTAERVAKGFGELFEKGFANRCETTKWVWICKHLEWNPPENPNQRKAAGKMALSIPDECAWKSAFLGACGPLIGPLPNQPTNPSVTVPEPLLNQKQEQKQEQDKDTPQAAARSQKPKPKKTPLPDGFTASSRVLAWMAEKGYSHIDRHVENFVSYVKRSGKTYADWDEALMTAIRDDWAKVGAKTENDDWRKGMK